MKRLLLALGLLSCAIWAHPQDPPLNEDAGPGGLYEWKSERFRFPNGEFREAVSTTVYLFVGADGKSGMAVPTHGGISAGDLAGSELKLRCPLFGSSFAKAPESIQNAISARGEFKWLRVLTYDGGKTFSGDYDTFYVRWVGEELKELERFKVPVRLRRLPCSVKGVSIKAQGFETMLSDLDRQVADAQRSLDDRRTRLKAANEALGEWVAKHVAADDDLKAKKTAYFRALEAIGTSGVSRKNAELRNGESRLQRIAARRDQIADRVAYIRREMPGTPASVIERLVKEDADLKKEDAALRQRVRALEDRLGITAAKRQAEQAARAAEDAMWNARKAEARLGSDRNLAMRAVEYQREDVQAEEKRLLDVLKRRAFAEGTQVPLVRELRVKVPGTAWRGYLHASDEILKTHDEMIAEQRRVVESASRRRRQIRSEFDEQGRRAMDAGDALYRGQLISAYSQYGIEVFSNVYEVLEATAQGGLVGAGAEFGKKLIELGIGGTDDVIVAARVMPPTPELGALEITTGQTAVGAGKATLVESGKNAIKGAYDLGTGLAATRAMKGYYESRIALGEQLYRKAWAEYVDSRYPEYKPSYLNRIRQFIRGDLGADQLSTTLRSDAAFRGDIVNKMTERYENLTKAGRWKAIGKDVAGGIAKGIAMDLAKAGAKQFIADFFEGVPYLTYVEENLKLKGLAVMLMQAADHQYQAEDLLRDMVAMREHSFKQFNPELGMRVAINRPFFMAKSLEVELDFVDPTVLDASRITVEVLVNGIKLRERSPFVRFEPDVLNENMIGFGSEMQMEVRIKPKASTLLHLLSQTR